MKRLSLFVATTLLALGSASLTASADIRVPSGASLAQTPIVQPAACNGRTGIYGCGPGWTWRCNRWGCRCRRC